MTKYSIPKIFDGGVYGSLCRNKQKRGVKRLILYICAVIALGLNAFLVWLGGSSLGIIGLITNIVYDIFIFAFAPHDGMTSVGIGCVRIIHWMKF